MNVSTWLASLGLAELARTFETNGVDRDLLRHLTNDDLKDLGVARLKDRKILLEAIARLSDAPGPEATPQTGPVVPKPAGDGERRHLSVMFIDIVGSTRLAARLDPEQVVHVVKLFRETCAEVIGQHDGYISNYIGDGVVALFGYPKAHEDDAVQALHAGLAIIEAIGNLGSALESIVPEGLCVRVAVASGIVVVADVLMADGTRFNSVIGDTPNLAARLQEFAGENGLVASDETRRLAEGRFRFREVGEERIKGFDEPVRVWQVDSSETLSTRFEARTGARMSGFVGRRRELGLLFDRWALARGGLGQVVLLTGEAGIGKSRLCHELEAGLSGTDHAVVRLQCSPHHRSAALFPFAAELRLASGLGPDDPPERLQAKLLAETASGGDPVAAWLLARILSIEPAAAWTPLEQSAQEQKRLTLEALRDRFTALAARRPLLLLFEDVHWVDPTSAGLLEILIEAIKALPVLLVITERPESGFLTPDAPHLLRLSLAGLDATEAQELVNHVFVPEQIPHDMLRDVVAKTDGVPLFIEETVRMLSERRHEAAGLRKSPITSIPNTIYDLLLARIDQLGPTKRIAQQAACFGRHFTRGRLAQITGAPEGDLDTVLARLVSADIVAAEAVTGTFAFKHALIQNAAYESLLQSTRAEMHGRIALALEGEIAGTEPHILAHHFGLAGRKSQEAEYWCRAGDRAMAGSAFDEAMSCYRQALTAVASLPKGEALGRELDLQVRIAVPLMLTRGWSAPEVGESYGRAHDLCAVVEDSPLIFPARAGIFGYHLVSGRIAGALDLGLEYLCRARETGDPPTIQEFELHPGVALFYAGRYHEAAPHLEAVAELYDPARYGANIERYGRCVMTVALAHLGNARALSGDADSAFATSTRSRRHADESGHAFSQIWAMSNHAINHILYEDVPACAALAERVIAEGDRRGFVNWSSQGRVWSGWARAKAGEPEAGLASIRHGMKVWEATGAELMRPLYHILLSDALREAGKAAASREALDEAEAIMARTGETFMAMQLRIARIEADRALSRIAPEAAARSLSELAETALGQGEGLAALKAAAAAATIDPASAGQLRAALARFEGQERRPVLLRALEVARESGVLAT